MLLWCAVYAENRTVPDAYCTEEDAPVAAVLSRFDDEAKRGLHDGHPVDAMWLIDEATRQKDVIRVFGRVPAEIQKRHETYVAKSTTRPQASNPS